MSKTSRTNIIINNSFNHTFNSHSLSPDTFDDFIDFLEKNKEKEKEIDKLIKLFSQKQIDLGNYEDGILLLCRHKLIGKNDFLQFARVLQLSGLDHQAYVLLNDYRSFCTGNPDLAILSKLAKITLELDVSNTPFYCLQILDKEPNHFHALLFYGQYFYLNKNWHEALNYWQKCADINPENNKLRVLISFAYQQVNDIDNANLFMKSALRGKYGDHPKGQAIEKILNREGFSFKFLSRIINRTVFGEDLARFALIDKLPSKIKNPSNDRYYAECFDQFASTQGYSHKTEDMLNIEVSFNGITVHYLLNSGHTKFLKGDLEGADTDYTKASSLAKSLGLVPFHFNCGVFNWKNQNQKLASLTKIKNKTSFLKKLSPLCLSESERMLLVGADSSYFLKYFPIYAYSVIDSNDSSGIPIRIHCNVGNPTSEVIEICEALSNKQIHNVRFTFDLATLPQEKSEKSYYTCLRFSSIGKIFSKYKCPILVTDIDLKFKVAVWKIFDSLRFYDLALRIVNSPYSRQPKIVRGRPWSVNAQCVFINQTDIGSIFSTLLEDFINHPFDTTNPTNWMIDQSCLRAALDCVTNDEYMRDIGCYDSLKFRNLMRGLNIIEPAGSYHDKSDFVVANNNYSFNDMLNAAK